MRNLFSLSKTRFAIALAGTLWLILLMNLMLAYGASELVAQQPSSPSSVQAVGFNPYIVAIPGSGLNNGSLLVTADIGQQINPVYVTADQGPSSHRHSHTMAFESSAQKYRYTIENFFDNPGSIGGSIEITTTVAPTSTTPLTQTLSSGKRTYERWPVFKDQTNALVLANGALALEIFQDTFLAEITFVLVVDTIAPLQEPVGYRSVSNAYSIQASGSVGQTERPYLLTLRYTDEQLNGADPNQLTIFWFDPQTNNWQEQGGIVHTDRQDIVLSTRRLGTFMLFAPGAPDTPTPTDSPAPAATNTPQSLTPTESPMPTDTLVPSTATHTPVPPFTPTDASLPTPTQSLPATDTMTPVPPTPTYTSVPTEIPTKEATAIDTLTPTPTLTSFEQRIYLPAVKK